MKLIPPGLGAKRWEVHPRTVERWQRDGIITTYKVAPGDFRIDADEVEAAFAAGTIRNGRNKFGPRARVVELPPQPPIVEAVVPDPSEIESEAGARS